MPITLKEHIITYLYDDIKPIKVAEGNNTSYSNILIYSYFHNDVIEDMKDLFAKYKLLQENYQKLLDYKNAMDNWKTNEYEPFKNDYDAFKLQYSNFKSNYPSSQISIINSTEYYTKKVENGNDVYTKATLPTFPTLPSNNITHEINNPIPTLDSTFDSTLIPYSNYTYTWQKDWTTYKMPYNNPPNYQIKEKLSYSPDLQDYSTVITFSYLKFCNNRYENHMPLIL